MNLIVAIGKNGEIGCNGNLIWKIPEDLKRFKTLTMGHPVIMGRKTWESLPKKPLPGRRNVVLTHNKDFKAEGGDVVHSIEEAIELTRGQEPFIIGGSEIYNAFLPYASRLFLTVVEDECADADSFLDINLDKDWELTEQSPVASNQDGIRYRYRNYQKS